MLAGKGAPEAERVLPVQQGRDTQEAERAGQDEAGPGQGPPVPVPGTLCPSALAAGTAVPAAGAGLPHDGAAGNGDDGF